MFGLYVLPLCFFFEAAPFSREFAPIACVISHLSCTLNLIVTDLETGYLKKKGPFHCPFCYYQTFSGNNLCFSLAQMITLLVRYCPEQIEQIFRWVHPQLSSSSILFTFS